MTVRRARSEDATAMARVMAAVAEEGSIATEPPVDIEARAQQFRETIEGEGPGALWVLEDGGQVVGNAGVQEAGPGVLSLGMAILPEARGRGGGRALLEVIAEHARVSGAHKLELDVWPDNARAVRLYASAGFEVEGLRRAHYRKRGLINFTPAQSSAAGRARTDSARIEEVLQRGVVRDGGGLAGSGR